MSDGDYFGETALLQDAPRNATIRTLTDCLLLILPKHAFLSLLDELPSLRVAVDKQIEQTQRNREQRQVNAAAIQPSIQTAVVDQAHELWPQ